MSEWPNVSGSNLERDMKQTEVNKNLSPIY